MSKKKIHCQNCNTEFRTSPSRDRKFCTKRCYSESQVTKIQVSCLGCSKNFSVFKSRSKYGRGVFCSTECQYASITGKNCHLWKGGITPLNKQIRTGKEYKHWRVSVFERDGYTCQSCGEKGVYLHAHHVKPFAYFPSLRFEVSNGITLCEPCHRVTDTFGERAKKYEHA